MGVCLNELHLIDQWVRFSGLDVKCEEDGPRKSQPGRNGASRCRSSGETEETLMGSLVSSRTEK